MPPKKRLKKMDEENKGVVQNICLNESRKAHTDVIICSKAGPDSYGFNTFGRKVKTQKFEVEKAVLASHSITFSNMFNDCHDDQEKVSEVELSEPFNVVLSFLHIIYGTLTEHVHVGQYFLYSAFDHWIDVIDMGDKFMADSVIDRAIFHLCTTFQALEVVDYYYDSEDWDPEDYRPTTKYGRGAMLKFIVIYSNAKRGTFNVSDVAISMLTSTLKDHWSLFCQELGGFIPCINKSVSCNRSKSICKLRVLLPDNVAHFFTLNQVLAFQKVLEDYCKFDHDIIKVVDEYFVNAKPAHKI